MEKYFNIDNFNFQERKYKIICFDIDGTLTESKQPINQEILYSLKQLLKYKQVAILTGGHLEQIHKQILSKFKLFDDRFFRNLFLFPANASAFYVYEFLHWKCVYSNKFTFTEIRKIKKAILKSINLAGLHLPKKHYGPIIENRKSEVTFSALGMNAPVAEKEIWDPDQKKRRMIVKILERLLSQFSVKIGGSTSIDITKKNMDKLYGLKYLAKYLGIKKSEFLYIGDALYKNGNDEVVLDFGIDSLIVKDWYETKIFIDKFIQNINYDIKKEISPKDEYRPWGKMREFFKNTLASAKIIFVKKHEELSLQTHGERSEFWRVLKGHPKIVIGNDTVYAKSEDEFFIPKNVQHRIQAEDDDVEILEISKGLFKDEDIIRLKDKYGRK